MIPPSQPPISIPDLLKTTKRALRCGGAIVKKGFRQVRQVAYKSSVSVVTDVDIRSERAIIALIRKSFSHHGFLAEESGHRGGRGGCARRCGGYRWVIDPLDGTTNFVHGVPQACVSIAVEKEGVVLAGGVYDPFREELFLAGKGQGATLNGRPVRVSIARRMLRSLIITGFPYNRRKRAMFLLSLVKPMLEASMGVRRFGAAALDLAWIACGRAEGFWEFHLKPWDVAAGWLLVEEAGGKVTDLHGNSIALVKPDQILATNGWIHDQMVQLLRPHLTTRH